MKGEERGKTKIKREREKKERKTDTMQIQRNQRS